MACRTARPKTLELFVMSQCPYGAKALIAANDVVQHFGKDITLDVHYIGTGSSGRSTGTSATIAPTTSWPRG